MKADALVFSVEEERYSWRDVVLSAVQRGEWLAVERRARHGAACAQAADTSANPLDASALEGAARDFRYARDLVTALSMEEWLGRHELSAEEWSAYLRRDLLRSLSSADADELIARFPISNTDAVHLTLVEAICSGAIDGWARELAERAAAHAYIAAMPDAVATAPSDAPIDPLESQTLTILWGDGTDTIRAAANRLRRLDASLSGFRDALLTERAVNGYLSAHQLDLVRFECRVMTFPDQQMAAEAALLLREDGEGFTTVFSVAHAAQRSTQFFLDQIEDPVRSHFLGSRQGDLIGPVHIADEYRLYQIQEKVLPTIRDADVRRRAEEGVLANALGQQFDRRVSWQHGEATP